MINYEIKSQLAKLLATEDLVVEHKNVTTAQFNVETRVLTLPLWEKASTIVYDMLVGHEVGHALFTPNEWDFGIPQQFINVVEDARIEKLMKRKYPGIAKTFYRGYEELNDDDFFDIDGEDLTTFNLADRCNLYYKVGNFIDLAFSSTEKQIVNLIGDCETFDDTLNAAKVLYEYCKKQIEKPNISPTEDKDISPPPNQTDETFEEDFFDDGSPEESNDDIEVSTDTLFQEGTEKLNDLTNCMENIYIEVPEVYLSNLIASNSEIYTALEESWEAQLVPIGDYKADFTLPDIEYRDFKNSARREVNYLVKEFEMKKSADAYARATTARTGVLDCSKLPTYKFNEDIFKKITTLDDGKNHGLIFILDWSGSMQPYLQDTLKQLYNLVWFCDKVQIPFEVYAFSNNYSQWKCKAELPLPRMKREVGKLVVNEEFSLLNFLTSTVSKKVLEKQMESLWRVAWCMRPGGTSEYTVPGQFVLSGTPLNEAIISLHQIIPLFQKQHHLQKVQCVVLTDGESNAVPYHKMVQRHWEHEPYIGCRNIVPSHTYLRNRKTGHVYQFGHTYWGFTEVLLNDLKQSFPDTNFIGIRLSSSAEFGKFVRRYNPSIDDKDLRKAKKNKSYTIKNGGYQSYFVMNSSSLYSDDVFEVEEDASKSKIKSAFSKSLKSKALNKKVLSEFMDLVC